MLFDDCYNAILCKIKSTKTEKMDCTKEKPTYIEENIFTFPKEGRYTCYTSSNNDIHYSELSIDRYALEVLYNSIESNDSQKKIEKEKYIDEVYKVFSLHVQYVQGLPIIQDAPDLVDLIEYSIRNAIALYWSMPSTPVINPAKVHTAAWGQLTSSIYQACIEAEKAMRWRPSKTSGSDDELQQEKNHKYVIYMNFLKGLHQDSFKLLHYDCLRMQEGKIAAFNFVNVAQPQSILEFTLQYPTCLHERWKDRCISYEDNSGICILSAMTKQVSQGIPFGFLCEFAREMRRLGKELDEREVLVKNTASAT